MKWKSDSKNGKRDIEKFAFFPTRIGDTEIWLEWYIQHQIYYLGRWMDEYSYYGSRSRIIK